MARKKRHEEHMDHERWAIPYADLITLLLAFFVVMYAVSSINDGKYRILSDSMVQAFRPQAQSPDLIKLGEPHRIAPDVRTSPDQIVTPPDLGQHFIASSENGHALTPYEGARQITLEDVVAMEALAQAMALIAGRLEEDMATLIESDLVNIRRDKLWIEVEIKTSLLFDSGSAQLSRAAIPVLETVAATLRDQPTRVHVEGFTDNVPISTPIYPSNWELSAARAASVVSLFARNRLDPTRMAAVGYGEFRPIASNLTEEGRQENRRVAIVISMGDPFGSERGGDRARLPVLESADPEPVGLPGGTR